MPFNSQILFKGLLLVAMAAAISLRFFKGKVTPTAEGLQYKRKALLQLLQLVVLPVYFSYIMWGEYHNRGHVSVLSAVLFCGLVISVMLQMPGVITLTPTAIVQNFWLRADKRIDYPDVMAIESRTGGREVRVMGNTGVNITHNSGHADQSSFRAEMEQLTGKNVVG